MFDTKVRSWWSGCVTLINGHRQRQKLWTHKILLHMGIDISSLTKSASPCIISRLWFILSQNPFLPPLITSRSIPNLVKPGERSIRQPTWLTLLEPCQSVLSGARGGFEFLRTLVWFNSATVYTHSMFRISCFYLSIREWHQWFDIPSN